MARDGGLRQLFSARIERAHWCAVETWSTGQGVPDTNYCLDGCEGWIEYKQTQTTRVGLEPHQVGWIERRSRAGGRVFVAVRRKCEKGPRKPARDELHLFSGAAARPLLLNGLGQTPSLLSCEGGPASWDWKMVEEILCST